MSADGSASANVNSVDRDNMFLVCVGASAGGVEALECLFKEMPDKMGMAFVVIQHLAPDVESLMPQILARKTGMRVLQIADDLRIEPNTIYVLPGGQLASIQDRKLKLKANVDRIRNPIDLFFSSAAAAFGELAVGAVLSGTGSDGSAGVREIHANGGFVLVQNESSAKFNGMPRAAIATGVVDAIVHVEEIPDALIRFSDCFPSDGKSRRSLFAEAMSAETRIQQLLHQQFDIDFNQYKSGMFGRRLARRMMLHGISTIDKYLEFLQCNELEARSLYSDLLIGVTEFFRDPEAFSELQHSVLPHLLENALENGEFRIWVAPCATGEEPYSLAILVDELIEQRGYNLDVKIFATDANSECIEVASQGIYTDERLKNVSQSRVRKYFRETENGKQIIPRIRKQIIFAKQNVLQDAPFTKLHLISCRNLLIYFEAEAKKKILSLFNFSLRRDGILFLGPSESTAQLESAFETINDQWKLYRKLAPVRFSQVDLSIGSSPPQHKCTEGLPTEDLAAKELSAVYDILLTKFMPPGLLVDNRNQVMHIFGDAANYLRFPSGRPTKDLLELLPANFKVAITNGLKRARMEAKPVVFPGLECTIDGQSQTFRVEVCPVSTSFGVKYLITFKRYESVNETAGLASSSIDVPTNELIKALENELAETRENLQDSILNLKTANEEMQSTNEELTASNEELQSTNEELHSVNEELYTVNSEHQRKITELTELTDDMDNLLDSLEVDTIYLDRNLRVRKFTLGIANTFKLLPQDIGRDFASFNHELKHDGIISRIQSVLETKQARDEEVEDNSGRWYLMRLLPYNSKGRIDGVLLTLIDITKIKATEQRLLELSEIVQVSDDAIFKVSATGEIRTWNHGAEKLFLHQPNNVIGKNIDILGLDEQSEGIITGALEKIRLGLAVDHVELTASRRNGEEFAVQTTISPIYSSDGNLDGASIVLRDITAQKKAEMQIREEVRRRDRFLAVLSHELRNPTAAITNALAVLRRQDDANESNLQAVDIIQRHSMQLRKMLDDLLHVSRVTHNKFSLDLKPTDIVASARQVVECIEDQLREKNQVLSLEFPEGPVELLLDETRIIQAQTNLLVNAIKYTPENGRIDYTINIEEDSLLIEIQDDGEGMSEALLNRIFEVFVQADQSLDRSKGGMGLGLPLVKMIADAHGGTIEASSDGPGQGSIFRLCLPIKTSSNPGPALPAPVPAVDVDFDGASLLLVEDNEGARVMLSQFLELEGFEIETAETGVDGVEKFHHVKPDICVVDIGLPDLNGFEVARQICSSTYPPQLLVALTGYGQESDRRNVMDAGFDLHLVKPLDPEVLLQEMASHLKKAKTKHDYQRIETAS